MCRIPRVGTSGKRHVARSKLIQIYVDAQAIFPHFWGLSLSQTFEYETKFSFWLKSASLFKVVRHSMKVWSRATSDSLLVVRSWGPSTRPPQTDLEVPKSFDGLWFYQFIHKGELISLASQWWYSLNYPTNWRWKSCCSMPCNLCCNNCNLCCNICNLCCNEWVCLRFKCFRGAQAFFPHFWGCLYHKPLNMKLSLASDKSAPLFKVVQHSMKVWSRSASDSLSVVRTLDPPQTDLEVPKSFDEL